MPVRRLAGTLGVVVALATAAACGGNDVPAADSAEDDRGNESGCPVEPRAVAAAVGAEVEVDADEVATASACTYRNTTDGREAGRVTVVIERLGDDGIEGARARTEQDLGPLDDLPDDLVAGADDGWVVTSGRAVQVAASAGRLLVRVAVADPALDGDAATTAAAAIAEEALAS